MLVALYADSYNLAALTAIVNFLSIFKIGVPQCFERVHSANNVEVSFQRSTIYEKEYQFPLPLKKKVSVRRMMEDGRISEAVYKIITKATKSRYTYAFCLNLKIWTKLI
jgi:hypothetical protein